MPPPSSPPLSESFPKSFPKSFLGASVFDAPPEVQHHDWHVGAPPLTLTKPLAAAIGNFDGVHQGHVSLINKTKGHDGLDSAVITFDPHPRRFFAPDAPGFSLADHGDKRGFLAGCGVDHVIELRFDAALRQTNAADFITEVLPALGVQQLHAGADFTFGTNREGSMDVLQSLGAAAGITARPCAIETHDGAAISSSRIREVLAKGDMQAAMGLLGRPYIMSGEVTHGDKQGRLIGFPTANMHCPLLQPPRHGVYAVAVRLSDAPDAPILGGIANYGRRPTVKDRGTLLEAHLFDYDGDLYGQRLNVMLLDFIRPEQAFAGIDALRQQISTDAARVRRFHLDKTGLITA